MFILLKTIHQIYRFANKTMLLFHSITKFNFLTIKFKNSITSDLDKDGIFQNVIFK